MWNKKHWSTPTIKKWRGIAFFLFSFIPVFLGLFKPLMAQSLLLKHYTIRDGLAPGRINCIFQDSRGFLWIGAENGLSRFDGLQFENIYRSDIFSSDCIWDIAETPEGELWFCTMLGGAVRLRDGQFKSFTTADGLPNDTILGIARDKDGILWFATFDGLGRWDGGKFKHYTTADGLPDNRLTSIVCDKSGEIWFGTWNGLCHIKENRIITYKRADGLLSNIISYVTADSSGGIWVCTDKGFNLRKEGIFYSYSTRDGLVDNFIYRMAIDKNQRAWVCTSSGISRFSGGKFTNFTSRQGLPDSPIRCICRDREGSLWLGAKNGLTRVDSFGNVLFSSRDGLPQSGVNAILQDSKGGYWFGTNRGVRTYQGKKFKPFSIRNGRPASLITCLMEDSGGRIWIGGTHGLSIYSGGTFRHLTGRHGLPDKYINALIEDRNRDVLVATAGGLCRFRMKRGDIVQSKLKEASTEVYTLLVDKRGALWFSNTKGLNRVSNNRVTLYSMEQGGPHKWIHSLCEDTGGRIWIASARGCSVFDGNSFRSFTTGDGLNSNVCLFVMPAPGGDVWVGTPKGLNRIEGAGFKITAIGNIPLTSQLNEGAGFRDREGNIWCGSTDGVIRFNPASVSRAPPPPPVYINSWSALGEALPLEPGRRLSSERNFIEFGFLGISFTQAQSMEYRYRLNSGARLGQWMKTKNRSVSFAYLPPGGYTFEVVSRTSGVESPGPATMNFTILPPFHQTWWFRSILLALLGLLAAVLNLWRSRRLKEKVKMQERTRQLVMAQKMELLGLLAGGAVHDLKNLLTIIIGYSGRVAKSLGHKESNLSFIQKIQKAATTAVRLSKQILAFTKGQYPQNRPINLGQLLTDTIDTLKITIPENIAIQVDIPGDEHALRYLINPTHFQQVVMNLCINAANAMPGGGDIHIALSGVQNQGVRLEISDTGTGIEEEKLGKIFDPLYTTGEQSKGTGLGLFVVKQIADEYKAEIKVISEPGKGSSFQLTFPRPEIRREL